MNHDFSVNSNLVYRLNRYGKESNIEAMLKAIEELSGKERGDLFYMYDNGITSEFHDSLLVACAEYNNKVEKGFQEFVDFVNGDLSDFVNGN